MVENPLYDLSTPKNYCDSQGHLVGMNSPLGDDPTEFDHEAAAVMVGCTRIVCRCCGSWVRIEPGWNPGRWGPPRHYECDCSSEDAKGDIPLEIDPDFESPPPWECAGHPLVSFPFNLDGVLLDERTDYVELVRRSLDGWAPDAARTPERLAADGWVRKLFIRLQGTGVEDRVSQAVAAALVAADASPRTLGAALNFFYRLPWAPGAEILESFIHQEERRKLLDDVPDPTLREPRTLDHALRVALASRINDLPREEATALASRVREELLRPGRGYGLMEVVARHDPGWFGAHAVSIIQANPTHWLTVLELLPDRTSELEVAKEVVHFPEP